MSRKYRIEISIMGDGKRMYTPQYKDLLFWQRRLHTYPIFEQAVSRIEADKKRRMAESILHTTHVYVNDNGQPL